MMPMTTRLPGPEPAQDAAAAAEIKAEHQAGWPTAILKSISGFSFEGGPLKGI